MHLVTVSPGIPNPDTGGGGNWGASLIRYFLSRGHQITHVAVIGKHSNMTADPAVIAAYEKLGATVVVVPYQQNISSTQRSSLLKRLRSVVAPRVEDLWPNEMKTRPLVMEAIEKLRPDCVLPFAFDAVVYTHGLQSAPRVAFQAEGPHINTHVNWRYDPIVPPGFTAAYASYSIQAWLASHVQERLYIKLNRSLTIPAFARPHYVRWAHRHGIKTARFITTPVGDPVGPDWRERRAAMPRNRKCKIVMIGHLHSTSNRAGLPIFFEEVLPSLEGRGKLSEFEIHIIGRTEGMPKRYDRFRHHPALRWRGPVYPADDEFLSADILLVTVPAKTGSRVRILNGFSYGCCVVAHTANSLGIPELKHEENCLMAETGNGLAEQIIRAASDPNLRKALGEGGRRVYEQFYTEEAGGEQYLAFANEAVATFRNRRDTQRSVNEVAPA